jgi:hypothetical protein
LMIFRAMFVFLFRLSWRWNDNRLRVELTCVSLCSRPLCRKCPRPGFVPLHLQRRRAEGKHRRGRGWTQGRANQSLASLGLREARLRISNGSIYVLAEFLNCSIRLTKWPL